MRRLNLVIENDGRVINIPFRTLVNADTFTMGYDDERDLAYGINKILDLNLKLDGDIKAYMSYVYKARGRDFLKQRSIPVRYSGDSYDVSDLALVYAKYYKDNHARILAYRDGIRYVKHDAIQNYNIIDDNITDIQINQAVASYFDGSYKKYRDAYFMVKNAGYSVKKENVKEVNLIHNTDLKDYDTEDPYMAYLQHYASLGEEEYAEIMDELAGYELDFIKDKFTNSSGSGLYDGINTPKRDYDLEKMNLDNLAEMSIEDMLNYVDEYQKSNAKTGCKK